MTFPLIETMLYGLYCSTAEIATVGFFNMCLYFAVTTEVLIRIVPFSTSAHTGVICGDPSLDKVETKARFLPLKILAISSWESVVAPADSSISARSPYDGGCCCGGDDDKSLISTDCMIILSSLSSLFCISCLQYLKYASSYKRLFIVAAITK